MTNTFVFISALHRKGESEKGRRKRRIATAPFKRDKKGDVSDKMVITSKLNSKNQNKFHVIDRTRTIGNLT